MGANPQNEDNPYVKELHQMQGDALLLLKFVSGRFDMAVAPKVPAVLRAAAVAGADTERDVFLQDLSSVLATPAEELAKDERKTGFLFGAIDFLTCLAKPATIDTIKFTRAYTDAKLPLADYCAKTEEAVRVKAKQLRRVMKLFYFLCLVTLFISLMIMAHVVSGQRIMKNLEVQRAEISRVWDRINAVKAGTQSQPGERENGATPSEAPAAKVCPDTTDNTSTGPSNPVVGQICGTLGDLRIKMALLYQQLGVWNEATDRFYYVFPIPTWLRPQITLPTPSERPPIIGKEDWERAEQRTEIMLLGLANYGIPVLLGLLGAMVFAFRGINAKIEMCSLGDRDVYQTFLKIILGIILGGLVSIVFDFGGLELSGMKLSLWAIAFLVGYAVQIVFETLDRLVALGASKVPQREGGDAVNAPMPARLAPPPQPQPAE